MALSTRSLQIFVRAVEDKTFAAAARNLLIDPAAVSRAVKGLEDEIGVLLFARSTRTSKLTADGQRFYRDCREILQKLEEATQRFRQDAASVHGELRVGLAPMMGRQMIVGALASFQRAHPQIGIVLLSVNDPAEIVDGTVDILLRPHTLRRRGVPRSDLPGVVIRRIIRSQLILCASPEYLERVGTPEVPADLLRHDCIALVTLERDVQNEWHLARAGARQTVKLTPRLFVQGDALREAALAGSGIIRLLACHVRNELRSGALEQVLPGWECTGAPPIVAVYRKAKPTVPRINLFVRHLTETFRPYNLP